MPHTLVLASTSPFRRLLLQNAGLEFEAEDSRLDERALEATWNDRPSPDAVALRLASAKAIAVSARRPDALVLGCDQTMSLGHQLFHKSRSREEARQTLLHLRGKTHRLNCAIALAIGGETVWSSVEHADMSMRDFTETYLEDYLDQVGPSVYQSVGGYQIEGRGIQLFDRVAGDYFTIIGLPLLPLLAQLRTMGEVDA